MRKGNLALIHTYKSGLLIQNLKYHLKLPKEVISAFVVVFCRWNTFPDLGVDDNVELVKREFAKEIENKRIIIVEHTGTHDHDEFDCRELIMNNYSEHIRIWIDSDELLAGRFWHVIHAQKNTAYKIGHTIANGESVAQFEGVPYLFGRFVKIMYQRHSFLSLSVYSDYGKVKVEKLDKLYNVSVQPVENPDYLEAKKKWVLADRDIRANEPNIDPEPSNESVEEIPDEITEEIIEPILMCSNCQGLLIEGSKFCYLCGTPFILGDD